MEMLRDDELDIVTGGNKLSMVDSKACLGCKKNFAVTELLNGYCKNCRTGSDVVSAGEMSGFAKRASC